jgi:hypothetical protein
LHIEKSSLWYLNPNKMLFAAAPDQGNWDGDSAVHRGRLTGNLESHLAAKAAALVNFIIAHRPVLMVVTGILDFTAEECPVAGKT